jgi:hypothetical protein
MPKASPLSGHNLPGDYRGAVLASGPSVSGGAVVMVGGALRPGRHKCNMYENMEDKQ